jgi:hypothetical protein
MIVPPTAPPLGWVHTGLVGLVQTPVAGSHVPVRWHVSSAVQVTGVPTHTPP